MPETYTHTSVWHYRQGTLDSTPESTPIVREHAATLYVNGEPWLTFICSPIALEALAVGFLFNENVITSLEEVDQIKLKEEDRRIQVQLNHPAQKPAQFHRTSTGVSLQPHIAAHEVGADFTIQADKVIALYDQLMAQQKLHDQVGGFHSAALSDGESVPIIVEDLGRHNCVDKLTGLYLLRHATFIPRALLLSGRISSEMVYKTLALGIPLIVSRTSPTSLAVQIADTSGITLIGYLRKAQFDIYSHPERLIAA
ncbi:MAG TPA: formate dehydrogenase accessory sulfurtransferase FdhD [Anaerolineaceae bacterium]|nr:MAG: Putative formate dehydrogenase subunit FdhD [Anaerolineae bacterium 49_20]HAE86202.1 formate dehydrogenase accessory sulfurtransferase FdhD [Anaerolineaceae bacterium]